MTLQLLLLGDAPVAQFVARARLAEANGYSAVWVVDERFYREVYSCLGQIAANTAKVLVGPCVTDPFARHPALTAMAIATLDEISGRRAILGMAPGFQGSPNSGSIAESRRGRSTERNAYSADFRKHAFV
jgi:5,10-methylenetetrahydromethanopterin reductase